jgi:selenocysteine lyase/cysteine desulfurase
MDGMNLDDIIAREDVRRSVFPVTGERIFMAHAGVAPLSHAAADAIRAFVDRGEIDDQENAWAIEQVERARRSAAKLIGAEPGEVALLGPTSLGLNLVAHGIPWNDGDEVVFYPDDYPANVYPWSNLASRGVKPVPVRPEHPGVVTWDAVQAVLTPRTRLVALASCHFLGGFRIDIDVIGKALHERGILFSVDAIQTLGAFPMSVAHVDFLSADSHKWMLGPAGAGIFYVKKERQEMLRPSLLGSWNVVSPQFIAQEGIQFHPGARRYEPGTFNVPGIVGMGASLDLLLGLGIDRIGSRILALRKVIVGGARKLGYRLYAEGWDVSASCSDGQRSGILSFTHPDRDLRALARRMAAEKIQVSLRQDRAGTAFLRLSPHFYNTEAEAARVLALMEA